MLLRYTRVRGTLGRVSCRTLGSCSIREISHDTANTKDKAARSLPKRGLAQSKTKIIWAPDVKPRFPQGQLQAVEDRKLALHKLAQHVSDVNAVGAYQQAYHMWQACLLCTQDGEITQHVILDQEVALSLAQLIENHYNWDECLDVLNLLLEMRGDPGAQKVQQPTRRISTMVDHKVARAVLDAILSPRFIGLPGRRLAGQAALQMFTDFGVFQNDPDYVALNIRICGFISDQNNLDRRLLKRINVANLTPREKFELALAHARCLQPEQSRELLATLSDLTKEQRIESHMALCASFAESAKHSEAWEQLNELESEMLWTADQTAFDKSAVVHNSRINIVFATAMALTPRQPFTYYYHTIASTHCSPRFGKQVDVSQMFIDTATNIRETTGHEHRRRASLHSNLFRCMCAVYAMCTENGLKTTLTLSALETHLHSLQRDLVHKTSTEASASMHSGLDYVSSMLRSYLWALVFTDRVRPMDKSTRAWDEIKHAEKYVPGFKANVVVMEPALVMLVPRSIWTSGLRGVFKDNAAFMISDEAMCAMHWRPTFALSEQMAQRAHAEWGVDHRVAPLRVLLAVTQGWNRQALEIAKQSLLAPHLRIAPNTLALEGTRTSKYFEQLVLVLSMFKPGADLAISKVHALVQSQFRKIKMTERLAIAFLYCCIRSRNEATARDILMLLEKQGTVASPRVHELYMRACLRSGLVPRAIEIFHRLAYETRRSVGEPSYVYFIDYMADQRESCVGAEHAFDAWMQNSQYRGRATQKLVERWKQVGMSRESRNEHNVFMPKSPLSDVLQKVGVKKEEPGKYSSKRWLRDWEFHMVVSLVSAYVVSGRTNRALDWEAWILDAIRNKSLSMKPELISRVSGLLVRHLTFDSWDHAKCVLDFIIAIDHNTGHGNLGKQVYQLSLRHTFTSLHYFAQRNDPVKTRAQIRAYLQEHNAQYVSSFIEAQTA
ncbi:hypothetical protein GGH20_001710 [Coemansia sp. RSA 1937]|nr:hypothetical protein GGH20_001710 [Coemansia sp. RSA 1937]